MRTMQQNREEKEAELEVGASEIERVMAAMRETEAEVSERFDGEIAAKELELAVLKSNKKVTMTKACAGLNLVVNELTLQHRDQAGFLEDRNTQLLAKNWMIEEKRNEGNTGSCICESFEFLQPG